jgi:hypothetical protein
MAWLRPATPNSGLGDIIRSMRTRPRPGAAKGLSIDEATRRCEVCGQILPPDYWDQAESGEVVPEEQVLLSMGLALEADHGQMRELFRLAGYLHLFDTLTGMECALEDTIRADLDLPWEEREALIVHLQDLLEAQDPPS